MRLVHKLKGAQHEIEIDRERALTPEAFATLTEQRAGEKTPVALEWVLPVAGSHEGKYKGHIFKLHVRPEEIDKAIHALTVAKERFAKLDTTEGR